MDSPAFQILTDTQLRCRARVTQSPKPGKPLTGFRQNEVHRPRKRPNRKREWGRAGRGMRSRIACALHRRRHPPPWADRVNRRRPAPMPTLAPQFLRPRCEMKNVSKFQENCGCRRRKASQTKFSGHSWHYASFLRGCMRRRSSRTSAAISFKPEGMHLNGDTGLLGFSVDPKKSPVVLSMTKETKGRSHVSSRGKTSAWHVNIQNKFTNGHGRKRQRPSAKSWREHPERLL